MSPAYRRSAPLSAHHPALQYPNVQVAQLPSGALAETQRLTLARALFMIHTIRDFERWLIDHADLVHGPLHSSIGQEAVAVGMALGLQPGDKLTSTHRAHHDVLAKLIAYYAPADFDPLATSVVPEAIRDAVHRTLAEILGLAAGLAGGRGGSMHLADKPAGILTSAIVGGGIPIATGEGLAAKLRRTSDVALAAFGDGATSIGAFHEGIALARAWNLPVIFLLENNRYSVATTIRETTGFEDLAIRAAGYDMPALIVDGMDPIAVLEAIGRARDHAVTDGPVLVEAQTYRYYHQNGPLPGSSFRYRTRDEEREWLARDPVVVFPRNLVDAGLFSQAEVDHVAALARRLVDDCAGALAIEGPAGASIDAALYPSTSTIKDGMLGPGLPSVAAAALDGIPVAGGEEITFGSAVSQIIARWLERDPDAFVTGEEVGHLGGGVFGASRAALAAFPERVLSSPICENGFVGASLGAAILGMHPIVELMYPDFALEAADQLFNHIPKVRYMYGGHHAVPLIVRTQSSRGRGYGPQHSCDPAALFALFPGWRIISPSNATEYVGLFNAAMLSRDPVLVVEDHRLAKLASVLPTSGLDYVIPLGTARLVRPGTDVTVLAWSYALSRVVAIAEGLEGRGISAEVIDPRWLDRATFDREAVLASVGRTGAIVVVEDALRSFSVGANILDYLAPDLFPLLKSSPVRVTGEDVYTPVSEPLETYALLRDENIERGIIKATGAAQRHV